MTKEDNARKAADKAAEKAARAEVEAEAAATNHALDAVRREFDRQRGTSQSG